MRANRVYLLMGLLVVACASAACVGQREIVRPLDPVSTPTAVAALPVQPTASPLPVATPVVRPATATPAPSILGVLQALLPEEEDCMAVCHVEPSSSIPVNAPHPPPYHTPSPNCLDCHAPPPTPVTALVTPAPPAPATHLGRMNPACPLCHLPQ